MIWFGENFVPVFTPRDREGEFSRMQRGIRWVAERTPGATGEELVSALSESGWVSTETARRLLPYFRDFDADRYFAERLRRLSFRGELAVDEFRRRIGQVMVDLTEEGERVVLSGGAEAVRFRAGERDGLVFAFPEVSYAVDPELRAAVPDVLEHFPHTVVLVARNFRPGAEAAFRSLFRGQEIAPTTVTVNRLLGLRAVALRYRTPADRVMDLLCSGSGVSTRAVARLGDRELAAA